MQKVWGWPHRYNRFGNDSEISSIKHSLSITMRLVPSMDIYINVVTSLKSVDDIYYVTYIWQYTRKKRKINLEKWRRKPSNSACENFPDNNEIFLAWELFTERMDLSLATLPNMLSNLTFKNLPSFSHFGHQLNRRTQKLQVNQACL